MIWPDRHIIGYAFFLAAFLLFIWGIRINGRPWWARREPVDEPATEAEIMAKLQQRLDAAAPDPNETLLERMLREGQDRLPKWPPD